MLKRIVCFANSRKLDGKCFAGKEINTDIWVRPISERENNSLYNDEECIKGNNCECSTCSPQIPALLDVVEIDLAEYVGEAHQVENFRIGTLKWKKLGVLDANHIDNYLDFCPEGLWVDGYQALNRKNDRVPMCRGGELSDSLKLIEVESLNLAVVTEGADFGNPRKKVNGVFNYNNTEYIIPVTDEVIENEYHNLAEGMYHVPARDKRIILCLSMGQEYKGYFYKFIAGVMVI